MTRVKRVRRHIRTDVTVVKRCMAHSLVKGPSLLVGKVYDPCREIVKGRVRGERQEGKRIVQKCRSAEVRKC